jgi:two-component system chemotaxis response regulator CheB
MRLNFLSVWIAVAHHRLEMFTTRFVVRLNRFCAMSVRDAENRDRVIAGRALVVPGGRYMVLTRSGAQYLVEVVDGPLRNCHEPSVDELLRSVAQVAGCESLSFGLAPARDQRLGAHLGLALGI